MPEYSKRQIKGTGALPNKFMVLGQCPGQMEDRFGKPFIGDSGKELNQLYLPLADLRRWYMRIENVIEYHPFNNDTPTQSDIDEATPDLLRRIEQCNPKYIFALGNIPNGIFTNGKFSISLRHGRPYYWNNILILPTFHPAAGIRDATGSSLPRTMSLSIQDWKYFGEVLQNESFSPLPVRKLDFDYKELTTIDEIDTLLTGINEIAADTEFHPITGELWSFQFSTSPQNGYLIRIENWKLCEAFASKINQTKPFVIYHAAPVDHPKMTSIGCKIERFTDTMQAAFCLANLPKGLKALGYRLLNLDMPSYTETVSEARNKIAIEYFSKILSMDWPDIPMTKVREPDGSWKLYKPQNIKVRIKRMWLKYFGDPERYIKDKIAFEKKLNKSNMAELNLRTKSFELHKTLKKRIKRIEKKLTKGKFTKDEFDAEYSKWNTRFIEDYQKAEQIRDKELIYTNEIYQADLAKLTETCYPHPDMDLMKLWQDAKNTYQVVDLLGEMPPATLEDIPLAKAVKYACTDTAVTFGVHNILKRRIADEGLTETLQVDLDAMPGLIMAEHYGIKINKHFMRHKSKRHRQLMQACLNRIERLYGYINPRSRDQVIAFFKRLGIDLPDSQEDTLKGYEKEHNAVKLFIKYRKSSKLDSTYYATLPNQTDSRNRIHARYGMTQASTTRFNSYSPNMQNQPYAVRYGYIPEPDCGFLSVDYAGQELRLLGHFSKDPLIVDIFNRDGDMHALTASFVFGITYEEAGSKKYKHLRTAAKKVNFGIIYGITGKGLCDQLIALGLTKLQGENVTQYLCDDFITAFLNKYSGAAAWIKEVQDKARLTGYAETLFGHRRPIPELKSFIPRIRSAGERFAPNHVIQGSGCDMLKVAMKNVERYCRQFNQTSDICRIVALEHDELMNEVSKSLLEHVAPMIKLYMETAVTLNVPVKSDLGWSDKSWGDIKEMSLDEIVNLH